MRVTFRRRRWLVPSRKKSWRSSTRVFRGTNARCVSTRNSPRWRWSSRCSTKRSVDAVASDSSRALDCYAWSLASVKSRLVLPFWYWLTWVVPERAVKRVCVCVFRSYFRLCEILQTTTVEDTSSHFLHAGCSYCRASSI